MTEKLPFCIYCDRTSNEVPLIAIQYRGEEFWICPQHLPVLIHQPARLAGKLPGLENINDIPESHE